MAGYTRAMPTYGKPGRPPHPDQLTPAEWKVVQSAQHGLSNPQIADRLNISINAVKFHIANAIEKLGLRNKRALLKWVGVPIDSAAHTNQDQENMEQKSLSAGQIARTVKSTEKSEAWYRDILGLKHLYTFGTMAFFDCDGIRLMLSQADDGDKYESIIYFQSNDIKSDYQRLQKRGIEFTHSPHKIHQHEDGAEEWMAFFTDLEGRPLGLMCTYEKSQ